MYQKHFLQLLHNKFFPQKDPLNLQLSKLIENCSTLTQEKKDEIAKTLQQHGENLLAKENLLAMEMFESAIEISPNNSKIWYRQGIAFLEYGIKHKREKALHLSIKNLKKAVELEKEEFEFWWQWGKALSLLGHMRNEYVYLNEAKEKFQTALRLIKGEPKEILAKIYWDYGLLWNYIATISGEAVDIKTAIQAYKTSLHFEANPSANFLNDIGNIHLQMGLLINNNRFYFQAIAYFKQALSKDNLSDCFLSMAHAYTELYINTLNTKLFDEASRCFEKVTLNSKDAELWLEWAQLLGEGGKITKDPKKLLLSIEKCVAANNLNSKHPIVIGQWVETLSLLGSLTNNLELIKEAEDKITKAIEVYSNVPELWYAYGMCMHAYSTYYDDLDYEYEAMDKLQMGISIDRTNAELWHALALCHANIGDGVEDIELLKRACKFYLRAISLKPSSPSLTFDYATALLKMGELLEEIEVVEQAVVQFEITLSSQKEAVLDKPEWLFYYGKSIGLLGDLRSEAGDCYLKAVETLNNVALIDPNFPNVYYYLGLYYTKLADETEEQKYFNSAICCFQSAIEQNSEDDLAYLELGLIFIEEGYQKSDASAKKNDFQEAEKKLAIAGKLGNLDAYYYLACLYSLSNRLKEAISFLKKAREVDGLPPMHEILEDEWLENLRSTSDFFDFISELEKQP